MDYVCRCRSPLGELTLASDGEALIGLWFDGQRHFAETLSEAYEAAQLPIFAETEAWLELYFSGKAPDFLPALKLKGTPFRKSVWELLLKIPYGRTLSYGALAEQLAAQRGVPKMSAQAVGAAVAHNPVSIIVPCHRVVGADGSLTGYAGGLDRKRKLLAIEGIETEGADRLPAARV